MGKVADKKRISLMGIVRGIIKLRFPILLVFIAAAVLCVFTMGKVRINNDLAAFLNEKTETRQSLNIMEKEFAGYASATIMIEQIQEDKAEQYAGQIRKITNVTTLSFDPASDYKDEKALFSVLFHGDISEEGPQIAVEEIRNLLKNEKCHIIADFGNDYSDQLAVEMVRVLAFSVIVIVVVLLLTSRSFFEVVIYLLVFVMAAVLNMGTNYWLGEISAITNTIAIILQLALAIDYAIIFAHRYQDELENNSDGKEALIQALAKSIREVFSSSLTTIAGLVALTLMQFRLGYDLGVVLIKGIICSMLTVFLFMPGLISFFPKILKKTYHRSLLPNMEGWGRILGKKVPVFLLLFALILPFSIIFSSNTTFAFSEQKITEIVRNERIESNREVEETFGSNTIVAMLVPAGNYEAEGEILEKAGALPNITRANGIANIQVDETHVLTSRYTPAEFASLLGIEEEQSGQLFSLYAFQHGDYRYNFDVTTYTIPLIDLVEYLFEKIDTHGIILTEEQSVTLSELRPQLEQAISLMKGEHYSRLIFISTLPIDGEASEELIETLRSCASPYYGAENVHMAGSITVARDLKEAFRFDSGFVNWMTIAFVFVILLLTFRNPLTAALLVFVIQGSIWINFSFSYMFGTVSLFVSQMIVTAIQMGATIDYAIVITNRYRDLRTRFEKREAMAKAVNASFPTVITSGTIMCVAGLLIAFLVSDAYVGHIGLLVGRGALISVILVLTVLPQLLLVFDPLIEKLTFRGFSSGKKEQNTKQ